MIHQASSLRFNWILKFEQTNYDDDGLLTLFRHFVSGLRDGLSKKKLHLKSKANARLKDKLILRIS